MGFGVFAGRLVTGTLALLMVCMPFAAAPTSDAASIRAINTMSLNERMHLPAATMVKLKSGRTVSLGVLRAEHRARLKRFATAAALGRAVNARLTTRKTIARPRYMGASAKIKPGLVGSFHVRGQPQPTGGPKAVVGYALSGTVPFGSTAPPGPAVTVSSVSIPYASLYPFLATDYVDFCSNAGAGACIYLPPNTTLDYSKDNDPTDTVFAFDVDPLILDPQVCASGGGHLDYLAPDSGCFYPYPINYFANFNPGTQPLTWAQSCNSPASYFIDPKGAVRANYTPPETGPGTGSTMAYGDVTSALFTTGASPITCVVQIWVTTST
jgi:hypothetical protein